HDRHLVFVRYRSFFNLVVSRGELINGTGNRGETGDRRDVLPLRKTGDRRDVNPRQSEKRGHHSFVARRDQGSTYCLARLRLLLGFVLRPSDKRVLRPLDGGGLVPTLEEIFG